MSSELEQMSGYRSISMFEEKKRKKTLDEAIRLRSAKVDGPRRPFSHR